MKVLVSIDDRFSVATALGLAAEIIEYCLLDEKNPSHAFSTHQFQHSDVKAMIFTERIGDDFKCSINFHIEPIPAEANG